MLPVGELSSDAALRSRLIALTRRAAESAEMMAEGLAGKEPLQEQVAMYILLTYADAEMDALQANMGAAGTAGFIRCLPVARRVHRSRGEGE